ncbi:ATP-binding protein [Actinomadura sp. 7K507]|uniref:ATP-binding protein n=1 Tax=Actinomadura sp. 7K507 TaxID=2530365 RepID=UPI00140441C6|nr:ATP-binding protein [Actinomadura sp. 7K507]
MAVKAVNEGELDISCLAAGTTSGLVRTLVEFRLAEWGLEKIAGDVLLIAGELVANAVQNTRDREIRVRFTREAGTVVLAVWDSSDEMPVVRPVVELTLDDVVPDACALDDGYDDGTGGWGLPLVQALSSDCGVRRTEPSGKWVWAACAC